MQSSSRNQPFKLVLAGASPATDAICSQGVISSARRFAKPEVRGASPRESTISQDCGVTSSISPCEGDGPGANPGFLTIFEKEKCAASAQGDWPIRKRILLKEQSQPRHKDLNAGIWMRAVRRAGKRWHVLRRGQREVVHRYSPLGSCIKRK